MKRILIMKVACDDDNNNDDEMFFWYGWPTKGV